ncbi:TonB-dependent receptor domain-containing protein [Thiomicrorhabdus aquaedulcis]|uniref:TonB-dependent receptor domain-containing protein n=1 Tax=Thiomicrorhabdus aquaedulcis TaxID=2211106 RepID=UPI000FDC505A|nr:TonB-dependent receptor [Thiomicrorhabdus aquaedulcis]
MFSKNKLNLAIFTALASASVSAPLYAAQLEEVGVAASAQIAQEDTVTRQELSQTSNSETGTALRQIPGVDAARMGGHGVDLNIRGQQSSQLNVLIDGAKIEGGCPNRMDPPTAYAELSSFDSVTVIKGVNSVTYGAGGSGGTVLFERNAPTFEAGKPYNGEINMGTSSNGLTSDLNATVAAGGKQGYIVLQGSKKSADNYTDGNGKEINSSYESQQGHIDLGWTPSENHELRLSHENTLVEDALFQGAFMDSPVSDGTTSRLRYKGQKISDAVQAIEVDLYQSTVDHTMNNFELRTPLNPAQLSEVISDVETTGAKVKLTSMIGHTQLDYGVQLESLDKTAVLYNRVNDKSVFNMWPNVLQETKSVFAESTSFFKDQQKVILGLRYDAVSTQAKDAKTATESNQTAIKLYNDAYIDYSGDTQTEEANVNGLLRYERVLDHNITVFSGLSRTHRYPDATEQFMAKGGTGQWIGNPDIKPEQHNQLDIGLSQATKTHSWGVSAFYDSVSDYILRDLSQNQPEAIKSTLPAGSVVYVNKDATLYGLEIEGALQASQRVKVGGNISLTKGTNETDNRNLSNIAPLAGNVYALYQATDWSAGTRFNFATAQTETNALAKELETNGWSTLDVYGDYKINKSVTLAAGVDNLFDQAYETYLNRVDSTTGADYKVYEPGRSVWARLNAKF